MSTCSQSPGLEWLWAESQVEVWVCVLPSPEERWVLVLLWTLWEKFKGCNTRAGFTACALASPRLQTLVFVCFLVFGVLLAAPLSMWDLVFGGFF